MATSGTTNNAATAVVTHQGRTVPVRGALQFKASALRPPIVAWLTITAFALAINLAMDNLLWAWYSFTGLLISATLAVLAQLLGWEVPDRLLWWVGVPLGLHYLGGSLSGLHSYGTNGLYYVFPWWDNVVHFLGSAAIAVVAAHLLLPGSSKARATVMAAFAAITLGVAVELYEFVHFVWLGTVDQGYYTNTMLDLYYNSLGASVAAWAYVRAGPT